MGIPTRGAGHTFRGEAFDGHVAPMLGRALQEFSRISVADWIQSLWSLADWSP